jgi:hypothetical protein
MKKFKQLKQQLTEDAYMDGGALGGFPTQNSTRSAFSDFGVHRIEHNEQLQRLRAFIQAFTGREYLEPRAALSLMRVKLNLAGLDFDFNNKTNFAIGQPMNFKLTRYGGTFGKTPTTPHNEFETTDGIEDIMGGDHLSLAVMISEAESGLYKMDIEIVRSSNKSDQGDADQSNETE